MDDGNPTRKDNGKGEHYTQLVLTLDVLPTWHLHIGGNIENADVAVAMLDQAKRYFEAQLRAAQAMQLQRQMAEQAENARIAAAVRGSVPHS